MSYRPASEAATQPGGVAGVLSSLKPQQLHLALPNLKELGLKHELRTGMDADDNMGLGGGNPKRSREQVSDDPCGDRPEWCKTANKDLYKLDDAFPLRDTSTKVNDDKWLKEQGVKVFYDLNFPHTYTHSNGTTYVCIRFVLNYFDTTMLKHFGVDAAKFTEDVVALQTDYNTLFDAVWSRLPQDGKLKGIGKDKDKTVEFQTEGKPNDNVVFVESGAWDKLLADPEDPNKKKPRKLAGAQLQDQLEAKLPATTAFGSTTLWGKKTGIYTSAIYTRWSDGEAIKGNHVVPFYAQSNKDGSGGIPLSSLYLRLQQHNAMELIREYERKRSTAPGEASIMTKFKTQIQQHCGSIADVDQKANDFKTKVLASASKKLTWSAKDVEDFYTVFTTCAPQQLTKLKERAFHEEFKYSVERLKVVICELHALCQKLEGEIEEREKKMLEESEKQGTAFAEKLGKQQAYDNWRDILAELDGKDAEDLPDGFDDVNDGAKYREALKTFKDNHNGTIATILSARKDAKSEEESGVMNEVLAMLKVVYDPRALNVNKYTTSEFATRETFPFLRKLVLYSISMGQAAEARPAKPGSAKAKPQSAPAKVPSKEEVMESSDLGYERLKLFMDNAALGPPDALHEAEKTTIKQKMLAAIQTKLEQQTTLDETLQKAIPVTLREKRPYATLTQKGGAGPLKAAYLGASNLPAYANDLKNLMPSEQWNELVLFLQGRRPATAKEAKDAKNAKGAQDEDNDNKADPVSEMYEYFSFQRSDFQFGEASDQETLDVQRVDRLEALRWYERRNELLQDVKGRSKAGEETYPKRVANLLKLALDYYVANNEILARIKTYLKDRLEFEIEEFRKKKEALQSKDWKNKVKVTVGNFQTQCERMESFIDAKSSLTDASTKMELPDEILAVQQRISEQEESTTPAASTSDTPEDLEAEKREAGKLLDTADPTLQEAADEWLEFFMEQRVNYLNKEKLGSLTQPRKYDADDTPPDRWYNSVQKILSWVDFVLKYASVSLKDAYVHFAREDGDKERAAADMKTVAHDYLYLRQANQQERTSVFAGFNRVSEQLGDIPKPLKMRLFDKWWSKAENDWFEAYYDEWYESTTPRTLLSALRGVAQPCSSEELGGVYITVEEYGGRSTRSLKFAATEFEYRRADPDGNCFYHVLEDLEDVDSQRELHEMFIRRAAEDIRDTKMKHVRELLSRTLVRELIELYFLNQGQYPNGEKIPGVFQKPATRDMGFVNFMKGKDQQLVKKFREKWNTHDYYPPGNQKPTKPEHPWDDMADEAMTRQLLKYSAEYRGQNKTWADQTDLEINAMRLNKTFHLFQKENVRVVNGDTIYGHPINAGVSDEKPLYLIYTNQVHYEGMKRVSQEELRDKKLERVVFEASEVCLSASTSSGVQQSFNNSVASTRDLKHDKDVMREIEQKLTQLSKEKIDKAVAHAKKSITAFEESILGNESSKDSVLQRACADYLTIEEWDMAKSVKGDAMHTLVNAYDAEKEKADKTDNASKASKADKAKADKEKTEAALSAISFLDTDTQVDAVRAKHGYYNDRYYDHWQTLFKLHTSWVRAQTSKTYEAVEQLGLLDTYRQQTFDKLKADAQKREKENYDSFVETTEEDRETRKATKNDREERRAQRKQEARDRGDNPDSDYNEEDLKDELDTKQDEEDKKKKNSAKNKEEKARDKTVKTKRHRAITQKLRKDLGDTAAEAAGAIVLFEADRQEAQEKFDDATKNPPTAAQDEEWLKRDKHKSPNRQPKVCIPGIHPGTV